MAITSLNGSFPTGPNHPFTNNPGLSTTSGGGPFVTVTTGTATTSVNYNGQPLYSAAHPVFKKRLCHVCGYDNDVKHTIQWFCHLCNAEQEIYEL